jgi:hypothetical protein
MTSTQSCLCYQIKCCRSTKDNRRNLLLNEGAGKLSSCFWFFYHRVWLCSQGWPQTCHPPASTSQVLGLYTCAIIPDWEVFMRKVMFTDIFTLKNGFHLDMGGGRRPLWCESAGLSRGHSWDLAPHGQLQSFFRKTSPASHLPPPVLTPSALSTPQESGDQS